MTCGTCKYETESDFPCSGCNHGRWWEPKDDERQAQDAYGGHPQQERAAEALRAALAEPDTCLRTAAQQALEAIRIFREWEMGQDYHSNRDTVLARAFAAEETLEAALAEPVQEPVASLMTHVQSGAQEVVWNDEAFDLELWHETPLYTAPPERKPLTDEEILDAFCVTPGIRQFVQAFEAGARFAERAHGIKGEQE